MNLSEDDKKRFWSKVDKKSEDECWNWTAGLFKSGYGAFSLNYKMVRAHCCSLFLAKGEPPIDKQLTLHLCSENTKCVNPNHLYYGTYQQNNGEDKKRDGTQNTGERHGQSKLTEIQVREIRQKYSTGEYFQKDLAEEYEVTRSLIGAIINNKRWKHVN